MPWQTPTLAQVRTNVRDQIRAYLPGSDASVPNSVLRVMSDATGALAHLTLQYIDWLALQLLPDSAEHEWLDRHGQIWLINADGTIGRKLATLASGTATFTGALGSLVPQNAQMTGQNGVTYETLAEIQLGSGPTAGPVRALDPGLISNMNSGDSLSLINPPSLVDGNATVTTMDGGTDDETDDELRSRVLERIQHPPMGGDEEDYVNWTLRVPGVTRAWCKGNEMGPGTVTVRFMMDNVRADNDGFPIGGDIQLVRAYLDTVRPVTVKDMFVVAPIPYPVDMRISYLDPQTTSMQNAIEDNLIDIFLVRGAPGQIFYRAWVDEAIAAAGTNAYDLQLDDADPPSNGHLPILGSIIYT
jgi:uncharacterized phage protein gp47/JayE